MKYILKIIFLLIVIQNSYSQDKELELLTAAQKSDEKKVFFLLKGGVNVNTETDEGITPLMYASDAGNMYIVKLLVKNGAKINHIPYNKVTALIAAAKSNHPEVVEYLLQNGASVNQKDVKSHTALMYAVAYGYPMTADILCDNGAKIINGKDINCLLLAAYYGDNDIINVLVDYYSDINTKGYYEFTPLIIASQEGQLETVKLLVDTLHAEIDLKNNENMTALDYAVKNGHKEVVKYLLSKDAKSNNKISDKTSTYKLAKYFGNYEIADLLKNDKKNRKPEPGRSSIDYINSFGYYDYLFGLQYTLRESKYRFDFNFGMIFRPFRKKVFIEKSEHLIYQLQELRIGFLAGLSKRFALYTKKQNEFGIFAGGKFSAWLGSYKGTDDKINHFSISPEAGVYYNGKKMGIKLAYEYCDYKTYNYVPHKINLTAIFFINQKYLYFYDRKYYNF